jgi:hypothetical protein
VPANALSATTDLEPMAKSKHLQTSRLDTVALANEALRTKLVTSPVWSSGYLSLDPFNSPNKVLALIIAIRKHESDL